ncbi:MAG: flagellar assembly protein FliW [Proteobacteria bacterium]|nr:flagellar assembly protein FliW [Pseudomonadota bacterium]MBU1742770.1 flagellar assembly protein FliW [Pseudomonadota bacterium]
MSTLTVNTSRFGDVQVDADKVITLPRGIIGFPDDKQYVFIKHQPDSPLFWLQSVTDPGLAFVVVMPALFKADYQVPVGPPLLELLDAAGPAEIQVYVLVTVPPGRPEKMTANLKGPLLINPTSRLGQQVVLDDPAFPVKYPLVQGAET